MREVVAVARQVLSIEAHPDWGTAAARRWDTESWVADISAARRELEWEPPLFAGGGVRHHGRLATGRAKGVGSLRCVEPARYVLIRADPCQTGRMLGMFRREVPVDWSAGRGMLLSPTHALLEQGEPLCQHLGLIREAGHRGGEVQE